jgi:glyoxylase-like metal-dependent hydrolase (beta-lactamase superfamily II)
VTLKGGFDENLTYLYAGSAGTSDEALVIDAAVPAATILRAASDAGLVIKRVFITHPHHDHWWAAPELLKETGAELVMFQQTARELGLAAPSILEAQDGDTIEIGPAELTLLHTPGHNPSHLCLHDAAAGALFTGDTLFVGRTGRTIMADASTRELFRSLKAKIAPLPDATRFHPGHDYGEVPMRTLGEERTINEFLKAPDEDAFCAVMEAYERSRRS